MATQNLTTSALYPQVPTQVFAQTIFQINPFSIGSAEQLAEEQLPPQIEVAGHIVHAPVFAGDGTLIVDTGESILELSWDEVDVLREVILSLDLQLAA